MDLTQLVRPRSLGAARNTAETADTNVLATAIAPGDTPSILRVTAAYSAAAVFTAIIVNGGTTYTLSLNGGVALIADALYTFDLPVHSGDTVNFQFDQNGTLRVLLVDEVLMGVASGAAQGQHVTGVVQGAAAHDAAASGSPVQVGGVYRATLPAVADGDAVSMLMDPAGRVQVISSDTVTYAHTAVNATTSSGEVLASNAARKYALLINDSDTVVYLKVGAAAVVSEGIRLNPNGGSFEISAAPGNRATGAINAIHAGSGNKAVLVTEGT